MGVKIERLMSGRRGENSLDECTTRVWLCGYRDEWTARREVDSTGWLLTWAGRGTGEG